MTEWREYTGQKLWYHKVLVDILNEVVTALNLHKIPYWLYAGTLLGAVRNGKMIPWDIDVDIGIFSNNARLLVRRFVGRGITQGVATENKFSIAVDRGKEDIRIIRLFCSSDTDLISEKHKVLLRKAEAIKTFTKYYDLFGIHVDVFPWRIDKNEIYSVCKPKMRRPLLEVSTLDKIKFEGSTYSCPHPPESNLIRLYGKDCIMKPRPTSLDVNWIKLFDPDNEDIIEEIARYS